MKKGNKIIRAGRYFLIFALALVFLGTSAEAAEEDSLLADISAMSGSQILKYWCDDFDGDGNIEVFAVAGRDEMYNELWFSSYAETKNLYLNGAAYYSDSMSPEGVCFISSRQKLFVIESGAFGSGSTSNCFYVDGGRAITVDYAGEGLRQDSGNQFFIYPSAFDNFITGGVGTGHTYKRYYLEWTGYSFREYVGTEISESSLESGYAGASDILAQARMEGFSIGTIYKRDNGIINVNLHKSNGSDIENENLTLEVRNNTVNLVPINRYGNTWISKYSFGGEYQSRGM